MSAFALMVDAVFADPHLAIDAVWRVGGTGDGIPVRVIRKSPEAIVGFGGNQFDLNAMLIEVRLSEVASPAEGDTIDLAGEDGEIAETVRVTNLSKIDTRKLVRTVEVEPVVADPDEDDAT
ncbi:hypothetical protein [Methylobacterium sp. J-092]|uniref:head-tail joining protein n=1 Tax=Methylobacterium sp. J-092 TaxID=2836667 RepID=UPI001FBBFDDD|nr:hypothetical protein [Methylobacterium sp. J-092]MCJ2009802.1 hypothetical protein [Methylobacterium sp. J-092]